MLTCPNLLFENRAMDLIFYLYIYIFIILIFNYVHKNNELKHQKSSKE